LFIDKLQSMAQSVNNLVITYIKENNFIHMTKKSARYENEALRSMSIKIDDILKKNDILKDSTEFLISRKKIFINKLKHDGNYSDIDSLQLAIYTSY